MKREQDVPFKFDTGESTIIVPDFALDETLVVGEGHLDLPPDFDNKDPVTAKEIREFTIRLQTTTEVGKFDEAIESKDLFTAFVQLGVAHENQMEDLFLMQQKFISLIDQYLAEDLSELGDFYVKLLTLLRSLVVSGELDRVFEHVTSSTKKNLADLTEMVGWKQTEINAHNAMKEIAHAVFYRSISDEFCDVGNAYLQLQKAHRLGMEEYIQMKADFLRFIDQELSRDKNSRNEKLRENLLRLRDTYCK